MAEPYAVDTEIINVSLSIENSDPSLVSIHSNQTVQELRFFLQVFLFLLCSIQESYNIPTAGTQIVIDGLLVEEDMIVRNAFVELTPAISVFYGSEVVSLSLRFNDYLFYYSFPLDATVELVAKGFNSVCLFVLCVT